MVSFGVCLVVKTSHTSSMLRFLLLRHSQNSFIKRLFCVGNGLLGRLLCRLLAYVWLNKKIDCLKFLDSLSFV